MAQVAKNKVLQSLIYWWELLSIKSMSDVESSPTIKGLILCYTSLIREIYKTFGTVESCKHHVESIEYRASSVKC